MAHIPMAEGLSNAANGLAGRSSRQRRTAQHRAPRGRVANEGRGHNARHTPGTPSGTADLQKCPAEASHHGANPTRHGRR